MRGGVCGAALGEPALAWAKRRRDMGDGGCAGGAKDNTVTLLWRGKQRQIVGFAVPHCVRALIAHPIVSAPCLLPLSRETLSRPVIHHFDLSPVHDHLPVALPLRQRQDGPTLFVPPPRPRHRPLRAQVFLPSPPPPPHNILHHPPPRPLSRTCRARHHARLPQPRRSRPHHRRSSSPRN